MTGITVNRPYMQLLKPCLSGALESNPLPDTAARQRRTKIPAELILRFPDVSPVWIKNARTIKSLMPLHQLHGIPNSRLEFDHKTIFLRLYKACHIDSLRNEHIGSPGDQFLVQPHSRYRVKTIEDKFDPVAGSQFSRCVKYFPENPGLFADIRKILLPGVKIGSIYSAGLNQARENRARHLCFKPVRVPQVIHFPRRDRILFELPTSTKVQTSQRH